VSNFCPSPNAGLTPSNRSFPVRLPQESVAGDHKDYLQETVPGTGLSSSPPRLANLALHSSPMVRIPVDQPADPHFGLGRATSILDSELADEELEEQGRRSRSRSRSASDGPAVSSTLPPKLGVAASGPTSPTKAPAPTTVDDVRAAPLSPIKRGPSISMIPSTFGDVEERPMPSRSDPVRISAPSIIPGLASKESLAALLALDTEDSEDQDYDQDL
jgi:hypothetical protein